jgi:hypothetical protein
LSDEKLLILTTLELKFFFFFLRIEFWQLSHLLFLRGVRFFGTNRAIFWKSNRTCQPDPGIKRGEAPIPRVGKEVPGFGIERAPFLAGVSALEHQATPAAWY